MTCSRPVWIQPSSRSVRSALVTASRDEPVQPASSSCDSGRLMRSPSAVWLPKRSASSTRRAATRPVVSKAPNSIRLRSASRSRRDQLPHEQRTRRGAWACRYRSNSACGTTSAVTGSSAVTVADIGAAGRSPTARRAARPGRARARTTSVPPAVLEATFTRPARSTTTALEALALAQDDLAAPPLPAVRRPPPSALPARRREDLPNSCSTCSTGGAVMAGHLSSADHDYARTVWRRPLTSRSPSGST